MGRQGHAMGPKEPDITERLIVIVDASPSAIRAGPFPLPLSIASRLRTYICQRCDAKNHSPILKLPFTSSMPITLSTQARQKLDDLLDAYPGTVPKADHPGTVVGIVNKQGESVYLRATGPNTAGQTEPMAEDAVRPSYIDRSMADEQIFAIFSCSKIVTAMAIMHLVENGGLDLDAPVGQWVPALADPNIIVDSTETDTTMRKAKYVTAMAEAG